MSAPAEAPVPTPVTTVTDDLEPCRRCGERGHECRAEKLVDDLREHQAAINALERWIDLHPEVTEHPCLHLSVSRGQVLISPRAGSDTERGEAVAVAVRAIAAGAAVGAVSKEIHERTMFVERRFGVDVGVQLQVPRSEVCVWVVTGTETVEVPDPNAPTIMETREVGEWRCSPLLAEAVQS